MKNILILFLFFSFWSCNSLLNQSELEPSKVADINAIITTVISQDSVKVLKTDQESALFCAELNKLQIYVPKKRDDLRASSISISNPSSSIDNLLGNKGATFFSSKDSLYLMQQNSNPKLFLIDTEVLQTIKCASMEVEQIKIDHHKPFDFTK